MTTGPDDTNGADGTNSWSKAWFDFLGRMTAAGSSFSPETPAPAAARQMRDAFFKAMSAQADEYMRSPEFLQMMKASMDGAIAWRSQMNEFLRQAHRESRTPSQEDIEDMAGRLQQLQRQLAERMEGIERQLEIVVELLKSKSGSSRPHPAGKAVRSPSGPSVRRKKSPHR
jgi:hypothetical protein